MIRVKNAVINIFKRIYILCDMVCSSFETIDNMVVVADVVELHFNKALYNYEHAELWYKRNMDTEPLEVIENNDRIIFIIKDTNYNIYKNVRITDHIHAICGC